MVTLPDLAPQIMALASVLRSAGFPVHVGDVAEKDPAMPYVMVQAPTGLPVSVAVCGAQVESDDDVQVTVVDDSPLNCLRSVSVVRRALDGVVLEAPGRTCFPLKLRGSQPVLVDRDVTLVGSGRHPAYAVDVWRLASTPTDEKE